MKFGHEWDEMVRATNPGWASKFLQYKVLKKGIKRIEDGDVAGVEELFDKLTEDARLSSSSSDEDSEREEGRAGEDRPGCSKDGKAPLGEPRVQSQQQQQQPRPTSSWKNKEEATQAFIHLFNVEMKKINLFFLNREEDIVIAWQSLKDQVARLSARPGGFAGMDRGTKEAVIASVVQLHGDAVWLEHFGRMNISACGKILKKMDKKMSVRAKEAVMEQVAALPFSQPHTLRQVIEAIEGIYARFGLGDGISGGVDKVVQDLPPGEVKERLLRQLAALDSARGSTAHLQKKMEEAIKERVSVESAPKKARVDVET